MNKDVCVLMTVYNVEPSIGSTIRSILSQNYQKFELLIINDGSKDGTAKVLKSFADHDPRIRVIYKENSGIRDSLNVGLNNTNAEYIIRHDAEDISHRERFGILVNELERRKNVSCIATKNIVVSEMYSVLGVFPMKDVKDLNVSIDQNETYISHPSVIFRRSDVMSIGGYPDVRHAEDFALWKRMRAHGMNFYFLNKPLYAIIKSSKGISSENMQKQMENVLSYIGQSFTTAQIKEMVEKKIIHEKIVYQVQHESISTKFTHYLKPWILWGMQQVLKIRFAKYLRGYDF